MITEIAQIEIKPGTEKDYEAAIAKATTLSPPQGFHGFELHRSIEKPPAALITRLMKTSPCDDLFGVQCYECEDGGDTEPDTLRGEVVQAQKGNTL